jgi:bifunctional non-homologous end joining protein LigD
VESLARLRSRSCIIDGEAVACDDKGVTSFDLVRHHRANDDVFLYAFDLIELDGDDLRRRAVNREAEEDWGRVCQEKSNISPA